MTVIRDPIEAFVYIQNQQGWSQAFGQAAQFLRMPFFELHKGFVLRKSLKETINIPAPDVAVTITQLDREDLALMETIVPPLRVKRLGRKMQAGELCCVAIRGEKVVAYVLAGFADTPSTKEARLELGPKDAYLWSGYALPQYRRQGVVRAVNLSLCRQLQGKGFIDVILLVDKQNKASLGHCYKMGYSLTDRITYLRILGWGKCQISPIENFN